MEAGAGRPLRADDGRLRGHHARRRPGHAVVPGRRTSATSGSSSSSARAGLTAATPTAASSCASRTRSRHRACTSARRSARPRRSRPGSRSTAATRSSSTTARPARRPARRARSTRSTTTTSARSARRSPAAQWEDYEIEVVGQHYKISRNGKVINEWDNLPGLNSDRAGDPNTTLRQFARGYIGLQNHGGADTMQYRNIRVEDLTPGAPKASDGTGPFEVSGCRPAHDRGAHEGRGRQRQPADVRVSPSVRPRRPARVRPDAAAR